MADGNLAVHACGCGCNSPVIIDLDTWRQDGNNEVWLHEYDTWTRIKIDRHVRYWGNEDTIWASFAAWRLTHAD